MTAIEMVNLWGRKISTFLCDIPVFVVAPRRYLNLVLADPPAEMFGRLIFYSLVFVIIQVSMFSMVDWITLPTHERYFELALREFLVPLLSVPHFYLIGKIGGIRSPLMSSVIFISTYRPVFMAIGVVLYALFLVSESYLFALGKGLSFVLYLVGILLFYPAVVGKTVKMRFLLIGVSLVSLGLFIVAAQPLVKWLPKSEVNPIRNSVLYDPIGVEYDKVVFLVDRKNAEGIYENSIDSFLSLLKDPSLKENSSRADSVFVVLRAGVLRTVSESDSLFSALYDSVNIQLADLRFETPKGLSRLRLEEFSAGRRAVKSIGAHLEKPDSNSFQVVLDSQRKYYEAKNSRLEHEAGNLRFRYYLRKWGLIFDW